MCKTGCRGKVVYNAGPGAGGDTQELAVAVCPGRGYLASWVQCRVKTWGPMVNVYTDTGPGEKNHHFADAKILSIYKIKNN